MLGVFVTLVLFVEYLNTLRGLCKRGYEAEMRKSL